MKNTLTDLNNHLFAQLERLSNEDLTQEQLTFESERAKSISIIAKGIVDNASLVMESRKVIPDILPNSMPKFIG